MTSYNSYTQLVHQCINHLIMSRFYCYKAPLYFWIFLSVFLNNLILISINQSSDIILLRIITMKSIITFILLGLCFNIRHWLYLLYVICAALYICCGCFFRCFINKVDIVWEVNSYHPMKVQQSTSLLTPAYLVGFQIHFSELTDTKF